MDPVSRRSKELSTCLEVCTFMTCGNADVFVPVASLRGWQERGTSSTSGANAPTNTTGPPTASPTTLSLEERMEALSSSWSRVSEDGGGVQALSVLVKEGFINAVLVLVMALNRRS